MASQCSMPVSRPTNSQARTQQVADAAREPAQKVCELLCQRPLKLLISERLAFGYLEEVLKGTRGAFSNALRSDFKRVDWGCSQLGSKPVASTRPNRMRVLWAWFEDYTLMRASEENLPGLARYLVNNNKKTSKAEQRTTVPLNPSAFPNFLLFFASRQCSVLLKRRENTT
eukprot:3571207-Amphidinium_carterae.1